MSKFKYDPKKQIISVEKEEGKTVALARILKGPVSKDEVGADIVTVLNMGVELRKMIAAEPVASASTIHKSVRGVPVIVPEDFDSENDDCVVCGSSLDTGWECIGCGADHMQGVKLNTLLRGIDRTDKGE